MRSYIYPRWHFASRSRAIAAPLELGFILLLLTSALSCEARRADAQPNVISEETKAKLANYQAVLQLIDAYYIDERKVSGLLDSVMDKVLSQLDPHSYYRDPVKTKSSSSHYRGEGEAFGFNYRYYDGRVIIYQVEAGSPAANAGMLPGDRIEMVWGQPTPTLAEEELGRLLCNEGKLDMVISRTGGKKRVPMRIEQKVMHEKSVKIAEMIDEATAYIFLSSFITTSYAEVKRVLEDFTAIGMKKLIFDLRGNPGGLLHASYEVASLFLPFHTKLAGVKGKGDTALVYEASYMPGRFTELELVVLIDERSASAAEIVAGVLQDHDRALLIGQPTFGKGLVQSQFDLPDGGSYVMTTAKYYLPSGRSIQKRYQGDEYPEKQIELPLGSNRDHSLDTLLEWNGAFKTSGGRTVYGGHGVVPEILIKNDTFHNLLGELADFDVFNRYIDSFFNEHAEEISIAHKAPISFAEDFICKKEMLVTFAKLAASQGMKDAPRRIENRKREVLTHLKRWMSFRLYPLNGWKRSGLSADRQFNEALKLLKKQLVLN